MVTRFLFIALLPFLSFFMSCGDDEGISEDDLIQEFIQTNDLDVEKTSSGLYYFIDNPGEEPFPNSNSEVVVHYEGFLLTGGTFDSSYDRGEPLTISLSQTIDGWQQGIPLFGTGGSGLLIIPSNLAYGSRGSGPIPPNTPIAFNIELIQVN